jgi:hypothetical protein
LTGKITGKPFSHTIASPPQHASIPRDRAPDWVIQDQTLPEQALIYRLSGDYNSLHIGARSLSLLFFFFDTSKQTPAWGPMPVSVA